MSANGDMPIPTVKWSSIELPKNLGGLGIGNILHKNLILLFKCWWRFSECDDSLWKRILISVHNIKGLKASSHTFQGIKIGMWAQLLCKDDTTAKIRDIVEEGMQICVRDGSSTLFWHDNWVSGGTLKVLFPRLFAIYEQRDTLICQMGWWREDEWFWNFQWRRRLYEWEVMEVERLTLLVEQVPI